MLARRVRAALVTVLALSGLLVGQLVTGGEALAHSYLVSSAPADQESFATPPAAVVLTFNEAVSTEFSEVVVTGPDGATAQSGAPEVSGGTVTQPLAPLASAGGYDVAWRVVSADGHPITGVLTFAVTTAAPSTVDPTTAPTTTPAPTTGAGETTATESSTAAAVAQDVAPASSDGSARPLIIGLVIAVLALGAGSFALNRRRQATGHG